MVKMAATPLKFGSRQPIITHRQLEISLAFGREVVQQLECDVNDCKRQLPPFALDRMGAGWQGLAAPGRFDICH